MKSFKQFIEQENKAWKLSKDQILQYWQQLQPNIPTPQLRIIPKDHTGPTYRYDGIRVTGSNQFINSVMSRLKDLIPYESNSTRLNLVYKQQVDKQTNEPIPESFVFYVQARDRSLSSAKKIV